MTGVLPLDLSSAPGPVPGGPAAMRALEALRPDLCDTPAEAPAPRTAVAAIRAGATPAEALLLPGVAWREPVWADGMALLVDGQLELAGDTPPEPIARAVLQRLGDQELGDQALGDQTPGGTSPDGLVVLDRLPSEWSQGWSQAGGLLAISLPRTPQDWIVWFRPVSPWTEAERAAAAAFRHAWLEAGLRRADALAREREAARSHLAFLMAELDHRQKNTLANIQALLRHSRHRATSVDGFIRDFECRLRAMGAAHGLLTHSRWEGAHLPALVAEEMRPHADGRVRGRVSATGPDLILRPKAALALSLALHELATNAVKHGALSVPEGRVVVRWRVGPRGIALRWQESGGPPVAPPRQRGFGMTVLERSLAYDLGGKSTIEFAAEGVVCAILIPRSHIVASN